MHLAIRPVVGVAGVFVVVGAAGELFISARLQRDFSANLISNESISRLISTLLHEGSQTPHPGCVTIFGRRMAATNERATHQRQRLVTA